MISPFLKMRLTSSHTVPFQKTSERLEELQESPITEGSKSTINETMKNLNKGFK